MLHHDGEDRCRFHELYGNANKSIEACMFKLLEVRDALNNDSGKTTLNLFVRSCLILQYFKNCVSVTVFQFAFHI